MTRGNLKNFGAKKAPPFKTGGEPRDKGTLPNSPKAQKKKQAGT